MEIAKIQMQLQGLTLFRALRSDAVFGALCACVEADVAMLAQRVEKYSAFVSSLYAAGGDLGAHLLHLVLDSENPVVRLAAAGESVPAYMQQCMEQELWLFSELSRLTPQDIMPQDTGIKLPLWQSTAHDFISIYNTRLANAKTKGYGVFAGYHMFTLGAQAELLPVAHPDPQKLQELTGYEREREQIVVNTKALLRGMPANNILLYGDAGTGKSSTVKALANAYAQEGLRLIEVRKNQLYQIPMLMDKLAQNPLKFILFIDDLSFAADDSDFTALKAILEGNISARPRNIVVYATSNRRHMVQELHSRRQGDDLHLGDTLEEEASLAARFGITVTFLKPDKDLYAEIVQSLAQEYGLRTEREALLKAAEAHAIRHGGRSPRAAKQFVEYWKAKEVLQQ